MKNYYLVTDATAAQVEKATGNPAYDTPLGAFTVAVDPVIEAIKFGGVMDALDRALHPRSNGCPECHGTVIHRPNCKIGMAIC